MRTIELRPTDDFAKALIAAPNNNARVIAFVGSTAYRLHHWTLKTDYGEDSLHTEWVSEAESIKACTLPWKWRLKWRIRTLVRKVI